MKVEFLVNVQLGNLKTKRGNMTADVTNVAAGATFTVESSLIGHDRQRHFCSYVNIRWEKDGWEHRATLGTSHYPHSSFKLIPETAFERSIVMAK